MDGRLAVVKDEGDDEWTGREGLDGSQCFGGIIYTVGRTNRSELNGESAIPLDTTITDKGIIV